MSDASVLNIHILASCLNIQWTTVSGVQLGDNMAMQKIVQEHFSELTDSDIFEAETITNDLDEEMIFKRIRISVAGLPTNQAAAAAPSVLRWALVQADTTITPTVSDMTDDNRVICTGNLQVSGGNGDTDVYDHTITMRKLKGSSLYLLWELINATGASSLTYRVYSTVQLHYLEV